MSTAAPATIEDTTKAAMKLFDHIEGQIARANNEAQLTLAVDAIVFAALTSLLTAGLGDTLFDGTPAWYDRMRAGLLISTALLLLISLVYSLAAALPKLKDAHLPKFGFYFGQIAAQDLQSFQDDFKRLSDAEILNSILDQVYVKSKIAQLKFDRVKRSVWLLVFALGLWALEEGILVFAAHVPK